MNGFPNPGERNPGCLYILGTLKWGWRRENGEGWGLGASYVRAPSFVGQPLRNKDTKQGQAGQKRRARS